MENRRKQNMYKFVAKLYRKEMVKTSAIPTKKFFPKRKFR